MYFRGIESNFLNSPVQLSLLSLFNTMEETEAENCEGPGPSQRADRGQNPMGSGLWALWVQHSALSWSPHTAWGALWGEVCKLCDGKLSIFLKVSGWLLTSNTQSTSVSSAEETAIKGEKKRKVSVKFYDCPLSQAEYLSPKNEALKDDSG